MAKLTIHTTGLGKRFGREWVIQHLDEQFSTGEVIGIRGRNGSGKSTLLRMLCGQLSPSRGQVGWKLDDKPVAITDWYRHVSWTGPYLEIIEELTIEEMLAFNFGLKPIRHKLNVSELPSLLELTPARKRPLLDCSSGMRQRVLLGTALFAATPLLLLDEPTVTLDEPAKDWFQKQLTKAKAGRLTIIASNDVDDLAQCTRIISLNSSI